jgi:SAM-dependent methyltransferase
MGHEGRWQLSGDAAAFYERYVKFVMEPWVRRLVDVAALQPAEHVLDVACGTGFVARLAAQRLGANGRAVGIDLNASMIEAARVASDRDGSTTMEWRVGDAAALPFEDGAFDAILCQQELQFFPDRVQALREMRRVLRPRRSVGVHGVERHHSYTVRGGARVGTGATRESRGRLYGASAACASRCRGAPGSRDVRRLSERVRASDDRDDYAPLPEKFAPGHFAALPMAEAIARLTPDWRAALIQDMTEALRAYVDGDHLRVPAGVHVVTADV